MQTATGPETLITSVEQLEALYGPTNAASTVKEIDWITPHYRAYIEASPFAVLSTVGPEGLDGSPRGDGAGFVRIADQRTLLLPDRRGNNRVDSLRNIVRDPRVALLFLIPGVGNTLRVNGRAQLSVAPDLLESFAVAGRAPRSVTVITVQAIYFQCARALVRSALWDREGHIDPKTLPSAGEMLSSLSKGEVGGPQYDREWPDRAAATLW